MKKQVFEYKGIGFLISNGIKMESTFQMELYLGEQAILFFDLDMFSKDRQTISSNQDNSFKFSGTLEDGTKINIEELILISLGDIVNGEQRPVKLKVFSEISFNRGILKNNQKERIVFRVTNLEFIGSERTMIPEGGWKLDHFSLVIDKFPIEIRQFGDYENTIKVLRKAEYASAETAEISIFSNHDNQDKIREIVHDLCWLMSFATGNSIVPFHEMHFDDETCVREVFRSVRVEPFKSGNHIIPSLPPETLPSFLTEVYPNYIKHKHELGLDVVLNYYELMKRNQIMDVRCVLVYILLECLSNNAQEFYELKGNPIQCHLKESKIESLRSCLTKYSVSDEDINKLIKEHIYQYPTLQESLTALMNDFKMKFKEGEVKLFELRKEFVHKGKFPKELNPIKTYNLLVHFIDRIILHILGYTGEYLDISDGYKHKKLEFTLG